MRVLLVGTVVLLAFTGVAEAAARARCSARLSRGRVLVRVELSELLGRDLTRLVRLGLQARISVDVALMRSRRFWFDDQVERQSRKITLTYVRRRGFYLDRRPLTNAQHIALSTISVGNRVASGGLYLVVRVRLRVVTSSSLRKTANWMTKTKSTSGLVQDRLIKMVVSDLTRAASTTCRPADR